MQKFKSSLLAATVVAGFVATPVAATPFTPGTYAILSPGLPATSVVTGTTTTTTTNFDGDNALHLAGATSIQNVLVRVFNCLGTPSKLGKAGAGTNTTSAVTALTYGGAIALTCNNSDANVGYKAGYSGTSGSTYELQPQGTDANSVAWGFAAKYIGTGSGFGRNSWKTFSDLFIGGDQSADLGGTAVKVTTDVYNPFVTSTTATDGSVTNNGRWSHVQAAFSDSPVAPSELFSDYPSYVPAKAGAPVQFPLFVVPVAIAYSNVYGTRLVGGVTTNLTFNAQFTATVPGSTTPIPTLRLDSNALCGIFNGDITNWNDTALTKLNKKKTLGDANDPFWTALGAPIRLVGRMDGSGTTNIFTRHLSTVCKNANLYPNTAHNKYTTNSDYLPYDGTLSGGVDFTGIRSDTKYKPATTGTYNVISGEYFASGAISVLSGKAKATPTSGYTGTGLFIVANGGGDVSDAIAYVDNYQGGGSAKIGTATTATNDDRSLNGKIGYISADFVQPSTVDSHGNVVAASIGYTAYTGSTLSTKFVYPTAANALAALIKANGSTILPPETTLDTTGAAVYTAGDTRQVAVGYDTTVTPAATTKGNALRSNPSAWTDVLYADPANTLAQPNQGYPITGTTQFYGYTCYATDGNREAIALLLGALTGQVKLDAAGTHVGAKAFNDTAAAHLGIVDQSNLAVVPLVWQQAIAQTFLSNTTKYPVAGKTDTVDLYISAGGVNGVLPLYTKKKGSVPASTARTIANPNCTSGKGA